MNGNRPTGLFITGTDTDAGKTYVTASLAAKKISPTCRVGVLKPVASGCTLGPGGRLVSEDAVRLWQAAGRPSPIERVCPLRFSAPIAPSTAAKMEGKRIDVKTVISAAVWWYSRCDFLLIEGAGGVLSPMGDTFDNRDLMARLGFPVVLVAPNRIGVVHQVRASIAAIRQRRKLELHSIVLTNVRPANESDLSVTTNSDDLRQWLKRDRVKQPLVELGYGQTELGLFF